VLKKANIAKAAIVKETSKLSSKRDSRNKKNSTDHDDIIDLIVKQDDN
jgi:hypothetical protein